MIRAVFFASILALAAAQSPAGAADKIKIGTVRSMGGTPLYLAQDLGFYKDEGLDAELVWFDSAQPIAVAAAAGDIDFGSTGMTAAFFTLANEGTLKIIGAGTWEHQGFQSIGFMVSNQSYAAGVHTFKDLTGHSVAVTQRGSPLDYNLSLALEKNGVDEKTVRILALQSNPNVASALKGGQVDAAVQTSANIYPLIQRGDAKLLGWASDVMTGQSEATFTTAKMANEHPDTVKRFLAAFRKAEAAWDAAFTDKDGARADQASAPKMMDIVSKNLNQPAEVLKNGIPYYDPESRVALPDIQRAIDWYVAQGMIKGHIDAGSLVDRRYALMAQTVSSR